MDCLAILDSGNYAISLCKALEKKGYKFDVIPTPCRIAKSGCSYCLKFPEEFMDAVISESKSCNLRIREIYRVVASKMKNKYEKIL